MRRTVAGERVAASVTEPDVIGAADGSPAPIDEGAGPVNCRSDTSAAQRARQTHVTDANRPCAHTHRPYPAAAVRALQQRNIVSRWPTGDVCAVQIIRVARRIGGVESVRIRPGAELAEAVHTAFDHHREQVLRLVPDAEVEHVGATSVPGALTKGDLDVLVRVHPSQFSRSVAALRNVYAVHQPDNWTPTLASFNDPASSAPAVGVQLVVAGSPSDALFGPFREALIADPALLAQYNALKLRLDGESDEHYTATKGAFVEDMLERLKPG